MKKNVIFRIAAIVLMCTLVTACFASSTFARYTSKATGTANVTVAKWEINVGDTDISENYGTPASVTFDLFSTIKDSNGTDNETNVVTGKIAPGTSGSFAFDQIKNLSDVDAKVTVKMTLAKTAGTMPPLQYKVDNGAWTTWTEGETILINAADIAKTNGTIDGKTIAWQWVYGDKGADNAYGVDPASITVTLEIEVDQVD